MSKATSVFEAIVQELDSVVTLDRDVRHIRVSKDAIEGSVVSVPITPERARSFALYEFEAASGGSAGVGADPEVVANPPFEILVHPADWAELLRERLAEIERNRRADQYPFVVEQNGDGVRRVMGIRVLEGANG